MLYEIEIHAKIKAKVYANNQDTILDEFDNDLEALLPLADSVEMSIVNSKIAD